MEKMVLYFRVSLMKQDYKSQTEDLRRWAKSNNFNVVKEFGEKVSGYDLSAERIEYEKLKEYVLENDIKNIGVWEISRFSRSMVKTRTEIDYFTSKGINIWFRKEGLCSISDNKANRLLITILSAMAEMERETIVERNLRGKFSAVIQGKATLYGIMPYGYAKDEKGYLIINEKEAKIIKLIYDRSAKGVSSRMICDELNSKKVPTRRNMMGWKRKLMTGGEVDGIWRDNTIRRILRSELYKGDKEFKGEKIKLPAIISPELWDKVQENFINNVGYYNKTKYNYLFKGKIKCGLCLHSWGTETRETVHGPKSIYFCSGRKDKLIKCRNGSISSTFLDEDLWYCIFIYRDVQKILHRNYERKDERLKVEKQVNYYKDEIIKLEDIKKRYAKLFAEGYITDMEFYKDVADVKNKVRNCENKIKILEENNRDNKKSWWNYRDNIFYTEEFNIKRDFIENTIKEIKIWKVNKCVNIPWNKQLWKNEKVFYLEILSYGAKEPFKVVISNINKNVFHSRNLIYFKELSCLRYR